jgi:hypothetical protein
VARYAYQANSYAVYGSSALASANGSYAGYFGGAVGIEGDVSIERGNLNLEFGDVYVGDIANPTQICLYGSGTEKCIDSWGDVANNLSFAWTEE